jgi:hypothetical protein
MNPLLNDDELADAVRQLDVSDPLPAVDPAVLLARGRRGVRRRRTFAAAGTVVVVAAVVASAAALPDLGSGNSRPPVAGPSSQTASPAYLQPMPGVPRGEAALAEISRAEAQRRCAVQTPNARGEMERSKVYRGGFTIGYWKPGEMVPLPYRCAIPGDSRPTAAGLAVLRSDPLPRDDAGLLRNCSIALWHDVRTWRVVAKDTAPRLVTSLVALSPSGRYAAHCRSTAGGTYGGSGTAIYPTDAEAAPSGRPTPSKMDQLRYLGGAGSACPIFGVRCTGWVAYESGRTDEKVAKIRFTSKNGRTHDLTVRDGWYALAWNDTAPGAGPTGPMTVYDKNGTVIFRR